MTQDGQVNGRAWRTESTKSTPDRTLDEGIGKDDSLNGLPRSPGARMADDRIER